MADSKREAALKALFDLLDGLSGPDAMRNEPHGRSVPAGGLLNLLDGKPGNPDVLLSPARYSYEHQAEIVVDVQAETASARDAAMDTLLASIGAAIEADKTLGGAVENATAFQPETETINVTNGKPVKVASVIVVLDYTTSTPLG